MAKSSMNASKLQHWVTRTRVNAASCWNSAGYKSPSGSGESWFEPRRGNCGQSATASVSGLVLAARPLGSSPGGAMGGARAPAFFPWGSAFNSTPGGQGERGRELSLDRVTALCEVLACAGSDPGSRAAAQPLTNVPLRRLVRHQGDLLEAMFEAMQDMNAKRGRQCSTP
jgi:hypothetical protein